MLLDAAADAVVAITPVAATARQLRRWAFRMRRERGARERRYVAV